MHQNWQWWHNQNQNSKYITPREGLGLGNKDDEYKGVVRVKLIVISCNPPKRMIEFSFFYE